MKQVISFLLCAALLLGLCACDADSSSRSANFYYRRVTPEYGSENAVIAPEVRTISQASDWISRTLLDYLKGPQSRGLDSPFPRNTNVISWAVDGETLTLNLSESFAALSGVDLSIACSCIARTFLELLPIDTVAIQVMRNQLNGQNSIVLQKQDLLLIDDSLDQLETSYTVYFADQKRRYLIGLETSSNLADREEVVRYLIQKLTVTPYNSDLSAPIPYGTRLLGVSVKNGICTLDFSPEFESNAWAHPEAQRVTLLSIVNTLTQIEGISQVEFRVSGKPLIHYGALNLSGLFVRDERAIGPVRTGINEFDATVFLSNGSDTYLVGVPTKVRRAAGIPPEELILTELMHYSACNGFYTTIPEATVLNSITTRRGICYIDLSREFLDDPETLELSVHSIVASVCKLDGINGVQITVDGIVPAECDPELFRILIPQFDWFV